MLHFKGNRLTRLRRPTDGFLKFKVRFHIELFKNGVCPGALQPWISFRSMIFRVAICSWVVLELQRCGSPDRHFSRRWSEAALAWFSFLLEHLTICGKHSLCWSSFPKKSAKNMFSRKSCPWEKSRAKVHPVKKIYVKTINNKLTLIFVSKQWNYVPPQSRETIPFIINYNFYFLLNC
jgi:hypothetical protein